MNQSKRKVNTHMKIKTTHVGSLPRPQAMHIKHLRKQEVTNADLRNYLTEIIEKQMLLGLDLINNGELPRPDYISSTVGRISGFFDTGIAPLPKDLEELPEYSRKFSGRNGLITLNPRAPVKLPACSEPLSYIGERSLREELDMMVSVFGELKEKYPAAPSALFFTAPSPGTVALFFENKYYPNYETYLQELTAILKQEYEIISGYGVFLQIDCPDLAMGRHTKFKHLEDEMFLSVVEANVSELNRALANIEEHRCRAHICWGNYPGTHHCDIDLAKIFKSVMKIDAKYISIESSNHRHAHEWKIFENAAFPEDKILLPGVIDTTSNNIEHPELVAQRILNFVELLGPDRVIGSTDCGFASTASAAGVSGEIAWLKLKSLVEGAKLASLKIN
jgi:5-methyltetrahydropteroyltriglutamate--homocysteine methyltransferase